MIVANGSPAVVLREGLSDRDVSTANLREAALNARFVAVANAPTLRSKTPSLSEADRARIAFKRPKAPTTPALPQPKSRRASLVSGAHSTIAA